MVLMQFGQVQFDVRHLNFKTINKTKEYSFNLSQGIKGSEFVQFLGTKNKKIRISGQGYLVFNDPTAALDKLEKMGNSGKAYRLISSDGKNLGRFVITNINISGDFYNKFGKPMKQAFEISLLQTS